MKIAMVAPLIESVPPRFYGGTERVVSFLTEELVTAGHEVTLFASGDSVTSAELVACSTCAIRLAPERYDPVFQYMCMLDELNRQADRFDVMHFHIDVLHFPLFRSIAHRTLTTLHGRQDLIASHAGVQALPAFPWCRSPTISADPSLMPISLPPFHHGLPLASPTRARAARQLSRLSWPGFAREADRPRHRDRAARRHGAEDRRQDRPGRHASISPKP